jgi:transposase
MNEAEDVAVGIDVAKATLDVAIRPSGEERQVANDPAGIAVVGRGYRVSSPAHGGRGDGGYEAPVVAELGGGGCGSGAGQPTARRLCQGEGRRPADRLDAQALAHFGQAVRPTPRPLRDEEAQALAALVERRRQVVAMRTAEANRLGAMRVALVRSHIQAHLAWLDTELREVDEELRQRLQASPLWREQDDLLRSVPGIGPILSLTLRTRFARAWSPVACSDRCAGRGGPAHP